MLTRKMQGKFQNQLKYRSSERRLWLPQVMKIDRSWSMRNKKKDLRCRIKPIQIIQTWRAIVVVIKDECHTMNGKTLNFLFGATGMWTSQSMSRASLVPACKRQRGKAKYHWAMYAPVPHLPSSPPLFPERLTLLFCTNRIPLPSVISFG